jgi:hypothetical protein
MSRHSIGDGRLAWIAAVALLAAGNAQGDQPPSCSMSLDVELTPDVPNARDPGFLSSLLGDHPAYRLVLRQQIDDSHLILQLTGPGAQDACEDVVDSMRDDSRVLSIDDS